MAGLERQRRWKEILFGGLDGDGAERAAARSAPAAPTSAFTLHLAAAAAELSREVRLLAEAEAQSVAGHPGTLST